MDLLAANALGRALYSDVYLDVRDTPNFSRFTFLDRAHAERFYADWDAAADIAVAIMRTEAGRDPHDRYLQDLVGELSTRSTEFRERWARHNVRLHAAGTKTFIHPVVGELNLTYEALDLAADPGLNMTIYTAPHGSAAYDGLRLLGSWAASTTGTEAATSQPRGDQQSTAAKGPALGYPRIMGANE